ncbi:DUF1178 family protein [Candidatus Accumulibacter sp. ACC003]|uniref:DUF1178 family protein n=1 Tax=Candidatus Accumulibacter sp. ACC003 TaxID=2823334 RepID=UPI0025BF07D0|nr:DUF1178 family protein [Candidatus Accumulibacter sp. ACC003]
MIIFDLACQHDHRFEGWFQSRDDFDSQLSAGLVGCPECGSQDIRRVPSALHLGKPQPTPPGVPAKASEEKLPAAPRIDPRAGALSAYRQLTAMLLAKCEDVGARFAEEARKIHYREVPERAIRGEATAEECEELRDEGVEVLRVPRLKVTDLH